MKTQHNVEIKDLSNKVPKSITHSSQPTIKSLFQKQNQICGKSLKNQIDLAIMEMMTVNYQPIRLVEESGFIKLLNLLCPGYKIPSWRKISTKMMPYYFNSIRESIVLAMKDVKFVCLTTDSWTSRANDSYLAVTAHYIDNNFTFRKCVLAVTSVISRVSQGGVQVGCSPPWKNLPGKNLKEGTKVKIYPPPSIFKKFKRKP